jgi:TPR repeat protein
MRAAGRGFLLSLTIALSASGCVQPGARGPSAGGTSDAADRNHTLAIAAGKAEMAERIRCMDEARPTLLAGTTSEERQRIVKGCGARMAAAAAPYRNQMISDDHSFQGQTAHASLAAQAAERAGNPQEALRQYLSIDAEEGAILAYLEQTGAERLLDDKTTPLAEYTKAMNIADMGRQLAQAQLKIGIHYQHSGDDRAAAIYFQKSLNTNGHPDGDGMIAGEWLGYMYANGRGVTRDPAKARQLFSVTDSQGNRTDLALMDRHMLPQTPEGKTPALIAKINAIIKAEEDAQIERGARELLKSWTEGRPPPSPQCSATCQGRYKSCQNDNSIGGMASIFSNFGHMDRNCNNDMRTCINGCS